MKKKLGPALLFTAFLAASLLLFLTNPFSSINFIIQDRLSQNITRAQADIFVIGVDDKSLDALGPWNSWPRSNMARLISLLNESPESRPRAIGIDVMYFGATDSDRELMEAAAGSDNLIFASELEFSTGIQKSAGGAYEYSPLSVKAVSLPQAPLCDYSGYGFTNVFLDSDGRVRRTLLAANVDGRTYDNFACAVYKKYAGDSAVMPSSSALSQDGLWTIPYSAAPGAYGQGLSFIDVLEGRVPLNLFGDSIVLIGSYASGMMDSYYTPASQSVPMYGVEINANIVQALCQNKSLRSVPVWLQLVLLCGCLAACRMAYHGKPLTKNLALLASTLGWFLLTAAASRLGWLLDPLYLPLLSVVLYLYRTIDDYLTERRERLQTLDTFKRYVSPEVAKYLLSQGSSPITSLSGTKRNIAVLFVDIRGFTPLSESLPPEAVAGILNEYLTLTSTVIFQNGGTVDKFIGDATMALFNAPADLDDYVYMAAKTALEIMEGSGELRGRLMELYGREIHLGIGVHCGDAVVGSIGAPFRMDYTAIGDTVNTTSRLEGIASPDQILISAEVYNRLRGRIRASLLGTRRLKGKAQEAELYVLEGLSQSSTLIPS